MRMPVKENQTSYFSALIVTICIFFFWGFAASGNALLIPVIKERFSLSQFQSQMIEFSFYLAYFIGSLSYFIISLKKPTWLERFSPKRVMVSGLILSAVGTIFLVAAAGTSSYLFLLFSLFAIALGFALQQIVANPLLVKLGGELYGAHRLILAGAVNSFGSTIAPLVLSYFIFGSVSSPNIIFSLSSVRPLYLLITGLYLFFAYWFYHVKLPDEDSSIQQNTKNFGALRYPQLVYGMVAIFCYVGSEVAMQSNLPALVHSTTIMNLPARDAIHYFSLFGGSLMIGRFTGAIFNFKLKPFLKTMLLIVVPFAAFAIVLSANWLKGSDLSQIIDYAPFLSILIIVLILSGDTPEKMLLYSATTSILLIFCSFLVAGKLSMYCIICVANFSALMWPCIFMLAIKGLGNYTQQGSSLLIMMILGGAIIPPLQGLLSDQPFIGIHNSYFLPVLCLAYISWFAFKMIIRQNKTKVAL